jgi:putative hydrolase of the HAD superfamily
VTNGHAPRAVIFDLDETLHRQRRFTVAGYASVARWLEDQTGRPTRETFARLWGLYRRGQGGSAYQILCSELGWPESQAAVLLGRHRAHPTHLRLTRSAERALRAMRLSWRIGILTNGIPELQRRKIDGLGVAGAVDAVVCADELAEGGKPAGIVFAHVCRALGVPPGRAVMVGDDATADVGGGRTAGLRTIWLRRPNRIAPPAAAVDAVVDTLEDVPHVAARLLGDLE